MPHTHAHIAQSAPVQAPRQARGSLADRVEAALTTVAELVLQDAAYLPLFERLEAEQAALQSQSAALERARQHLVKTRSAPASLL